MLTDFIKDSIELEYDPSLLNEIPIEGLKEKKKILENVDSKISSSIPSLSDIETKATSFGSQKLKSTKSCIFDSFNPSSIQLPSLNDISGVDFSNGVPLLNADDYLDGNRLNLDFQFSNPVGLDIEDITRTVDISLPDMTLASGTVLTNNLKLPDGTTYLAGTTLSEDLDLQGAVVEGVNIVDGEVDYDFPSVEGDYLVNVKTLYNEEISNIDSIIIKN